MEFIGSEGGDNSQPSINPENNTLEFDMASRDNSGDENIQVEDISEDSGKRKRTSEAWNHFKRLKVDNTQYAECNYCKARLKAPPDYGTTHLMKHYDKSCKKRPRKIDIRQSLMMANKKISGSQELTTHIFNQEDSRRELAQMVILHDYPLAMVEHIGNTLKSDILKIYDVERDKCYKLLDKLKCRVAITIDMWTSSNNKKGFMAITAHYIDDSWILRSCILRFLYVPAPHTAEVLSDLLAESLMDWNIDRKLSTITVDNCTTNDAMLNQLLDKLSKKDLLLDGKDGLDIISGAIEKIRDSVVYWTASPAGIEKFEEAARQLHIGCSKKLSLDCKTRWNSTFLMLETAIIYKDVFPRVQYRERHYKSLPTEKDWENTIDICGKLKIFYQVTEMFSGTLYPTSNFYFPKTCDIKLKLDEWMKSLSKMIRDLAENMLKKYEKYWDTCHIMMGVAAVLDPRYKMKLVEFYFPLIYGEGSKGKVDEVRKNCYELLGDYQSRATPLTDKNSSIGGLGSLGNTASCLSSVADPFESDPLQMYDQFVASVSNTTTKVPSTLELDVYLEESVLSRTPNFDVLSWWKTNGVKYPNLQKMARDILAIPVSTVASESAFSNSGRLVSPHRSRFHPSTLEALMCARRWLWNEANGSCSIVGGSKTCPTMLDEDEDDNEEIVNETAT